MDHRKETTKSIEKEGSSSRKDDWAIVAPDADTKPLWKAIYDNSIILNNLHTIIQKMEKRLDEQSQTIRDLQYQLNTNLVNIDKNMKEIDTDIEEFEKDITETKTILSQLVSNDKTTTLAPSMQQTIEQNRLWRLYSNNFRTNSVANQTNLATQMAGL
jgi:hypothetical protein